MAALVAKPRAESLADLLAAAEQLKAELMDARMDAWAAELMLGSMPELMRPS